MIGLVAGWIYLALRRGNQIFALGAAAVMGTLTNSVLVLGTAIGLGLLPVAAIAASLPQIVFETVLAAVLTIGIVAAWKQIATGRGGSSI